MFAIWTRKMLLRLCKILAGVSLLLCISYTSGLPAEEPLLEVPYFPEVVFKGAPLTVHVRIPEGVTAQVVTNNQVQSTLKGGNGPLREITLFPESGIRLDLRRNPEVTDWHFLVVEPGNPGELTEQDGYLYQGDVPVILMPEHRLPPPLDRRWETVEMVENLIQPRIEEMENVQLWIPPDSLLIKAFRGFFPDAGLELQYPDPAAWFRVHGYLGRIATTAPADFVVVEMDLFDFERGMSPQTWFMKWQFLLQHLQKQNAYTDGVLFSPVYTADTLKWKNVLEEKMKGLASAHGLRFVDRSLAPQVWRERLQNQLQKRYRMR